MSIPYRVIEKDKKVSKKNRAPHVSTRRPTLYEDASITY